MAFKECAYDVDFSVLLTTPLAYLSFDVLRLHLLMHD